MSILYAICCIKKWPGTYHRGDPSMVFRVELGKLVDIGQQRVEFSPQSVSVKLFYLGWVKQVAYMLVDEKDGDILTLGVLVKCGLNALNFRLWETCLCMASTL
jgi:hypothetical protein